MDAAVTKTPTTPGAPYAGGFYAGRINIDNEQYALVVSPRELGDIAGAWNDSNKAVENAASYFDGHANTQAMAEAGSGLARSILSLDINGLSDWYLPSRDELEICYRNLKPTKRENYPYRGDNPSSVPPGYIYTRTSPEQTTATSFSEGGKDAFSPDWYWTSTQVAAGPDYAWVQGFDYGGQGYYRKSYEYRARAVRRLLIIE